MQQKRTRLASGLTILTDKMPDVRSATLAFWLRRGSRNEPAHANGIFHFIEHAIFKGTKKRSALEIAIEMDRLGGNLDAFTSHEMMGFIVKAIDEDFERAFDLLSEILLEPAFEAEALANERNVILEEIKMVDDSPEDSLNEILMREIFPEHSLGLPIEGTPASVSTFDRALAEKFHQENFTPANIVISASGNVDHDALADRATRRFEDYPPSAEEKLRNESKPRISAPIFVRQKKELEQAHFSLAVPFVSFVDDRRYASSLLTNILGDGNSSRLWQSIREKRGLAYSVGAGSSPFHDCGVLTIFAGMAPQSFGEVLDLSIEEIRRMKSEGVTNDELSLAKKHTIASILLSLEDSSARAGHLAQSEFAFGRIVSLEESLERIASVTKEDIQNLAREFFITENIALGAIGNLKTLKIDRERLKV